LPPLRGGHKTNIFEGRAVIKRALFPFDIPVEVRMLETYGEVVVSTLDDLLGFGVVPPTALRKHDDDIMVTVQEWIPDARSFYYASVHNLPINEEDLIKIAIIDLITAQIDRHDDNLVVTPDGHVYAIDNERIFRGHIDSAAVQEVAGSPIPSHILAKLRDVEKGDFFAAFAGYPVRDIEDAWKRKEAIQRKKRVLSPEEIMRETDD
jgi:hypothetical protein